MSTHLYETNYNMGESSTSDRNTEVFTRHNDSVLCCSIDNNTRIAVSGGIDDTAFVWDLNTKHVIFECLGHKESVVAAAFSVNSTYVATGDLNGYLQVRNTTTGIKIFEFDIDEINWLMWHNTSEFVLLAGTTKGDFWMWNVNDPAAVKTFPSYGSPTTAAKLMSDGMKIVSAYADGSIRVFDLKTRQAILQLNDPTNAEIICIDLNPNNVLLAVGCIDSTVKIINLNACKVIGTLLCKSPEKPSTNDSTSVKPTDRTTDGSDPELQTVRVKIEPNHEKSDECNPENSESIEVIDEYSTPIGETEEEETDDIEEDDEADLSEDEYGGSMDVVSVESALFSPCGNYIAGANNSGSICIWDVATQVTRCELHTGIGITRSAWSDGGNYITGCLDGAVRVYDMNLEKLSEIALHSDQILDIAYRNKVLVTASEDKTCKAIAVLQ